MILFTFNEEPETRGESWPCKAFRGAFEVTADSHGISVGFVRQYQSRSDNKWRSSHTDSILFSIFRRLRWGRDHFYYDGPHCIYSLGPISLEWDSWNCKHCLGEGSGCGS